ncbi:MAG: class I SAM-dependent methyltransferase [Asgard group archaeon]|nr:class I SAM-dependent methyltransferase [Asgard group archaeon]
MSEDNPLGIDTTKNYLAPSQEIKIPELLPGSIIDIGGGGEGVIGQVGGKRITAIDLREGEIEEAKRLAPDANFVVADATNLPFEDEEFDHATSFFTGMYMSNDIKEKAMKETYRVMKKDGEFWYWDSVVQEAEELYIIPIKYILPNGTVKQTGYGVKSYKDQTIPTIKKMLEKTGFQVEIIENHEHWYFLKAKKV